MPARKSNVYDNRVLVVRPQYHKGVVWANLKSPYKPAWVGNAEIEYRVAVDGLVRRFGERTARDQVARLVWGRPLPRHVRQTYLMSPNRLPDHARAQQVLSVWDRVRTGKLDTLVGAKPVEFSEVCWQSVVHGLARFGWTLPDVKYQLGMLKWQTLPWLRWAEGIVPCYAIGEKLLDLYTRTRMGALRVPTLTERRLRIRELRKVKVSHRRAGVRLIEDILNDRVETE